MRLMLAIMMTLFTASHLGAIEWREDPKIAEIFARHEVQGTFVLFEVHNGKFIGYDRDRAETRFIPASTFKIANTLIGLASEAAPNVDTVISFARTPQTNKAWDREMSLREGIAVSNLPLYQELARRAGHAAMQSGVRMLRYGNCETSDEVDTF